MPRICIIGAGISGLAAAWQLRRQGADCIVLEKTQRVGGAIKSERIDGFLAEAGPNSLQISNPEVAAFLSSIPGLQDQQITANTAANKRFLVRDGRVHPVPMGPLQALTTPLWSLSAKLRVLKEPFIPRRKDTSEESVADFVCRRLGSELYRYAINPLVGGIYAGKPEALSLRYGFPKLYALEAQHGGLIRGTLAKMRASKKPGQPRFKKSIISFKDGLESMPQYLSKALGASVQTGVRIEGIKRNDTDWTVDWNGKSERYDRVILTTPAYALSELPLPQDLQEALAPLAAIEYPPVSVLSLGFSRSAVDHLLDGFGVLVPECEQRSILGALFPSSFFEGRAPDGSILLTVFVGGDRQPHLSSNDASLLEQRVMPDLTELLGIKEAPVMRHLAHWPRAIPQYKIGYGHYLKTITDAETRYPGFEIMSNYRNGISLSYCLEAAISAKI